MTHQERPRVTLPFARTRKSVCRGSHRQDRDIVLLFPTLPSEGVKRFEKQGTQLSLLIMLRDELLKTRRAEHLTVLVVGFDQSVAVEEDAVTCSQYFPTLFIICA